MKTNTEIIINIETKKFVGNNNSILVVLDNLKFSAISGITSVIGPSGCGKTTLLNIIAGLDKDFCGEVSFTDSINPNIGYMFQTPSLIPWRSVWQNICIGPEIKKLKEAAYNDEALNLIDKYGLSGFINNYPSTLSQGMQQRVSLIRLLLHGSNLLLMDEPFSKIDFFSKRILYHDVNSIIQNNNKSIILVTHDLEEAVLLADKVVVLSQRPAKVLAEIEIPVPRSARISDVPGVNDKLQPYLEKVWESMDKSSLN